MTLIELVCSIRYHEANFKRDKALQFASGAAILRKTVAGLSIDFSSLF